MKHVTYCTKGTCSRLINVDIDENGCLCDVSFVGGCDGNLKGICSLVKGMKVKDVIDRLNGIKCGKKNTSCPDQLCRALEEIDK